MDLLVDDQPKISYLLRQSAEVEADVTPMGPAIDDPTTVFLRYLTEGDVAVSQETPSVAADAGSIPEPPPDINGDGQQAEYLISLFAALAVHCRRADLQLADAITERIAEIGGPQYPELEELARSMVARSRGDYRRAESLLTSCLRRSHAYESLTRPAALTERATLRMMLGLLDAALNDLTEAEQYGQTLLTLHGLAVRALIHWWRGDTDQAIEALEQGPGSMIAGLDLGVEWYGLAAEFVRNGHIFAENLDEHDDCLAHEFWNERGFDSTPAFVTVLGPHMIRHRLALGQDARSLLDDLRSGNIADSAAARTFTWCVALVEGDVDLLAETADRFRDEGLLLAAIQAYRDAAINSESPESAERFNRRGRLIYERLSRAIKVKSQPELPESLAQALTDAEQNVVAAVAQGLSNREAAEFLNCSVRTVESHLTSSYRKLGIKRRTQLAVLIAQANIES